ncbi:hypothetical protein PMI10_00023 [Flavobacterium sp. CF136]|nr:hypothetical protein PMI10_00023 [Flavobacterium sp. CF136]
MRIPFQRSGKLENSPAADLVGDNNKDKVIKLFLSSDDSELNKKNRIIIILNIKYEKLYT